MAASWAASLANTLRVVEDPTPAPVMGDTVLARGMEVAQVTDNNLMVDMASNPSTPNNNNPLKRAAWAVVRVLLSVNYPAFRSVSKSGPHAISRLQVQVQVYWEVCSSPKVSNISLTRDATRDITRDTTMDMTRDMTTVTTVATSITIFEASMRDFCPVRVLYPHPL